MTAATQPWKGSVSYTDAIEREIAALGEAIAAAPARRYHPRWLAIQLLEGDEAQVEVLLTHGVPAHARPAVRPALERARRRLQAVCGPELDLAFADERYRAVNALISEVLVRPAGQTMSRSDRLDRVLTHPWLGLPILLALMWVVFNLVQTVSAPYLDWIDGVIGGVFAGWTGALLTAARAPGWLESLVLDGLIAGVGGVLVFLPGLLVMYFSLAFLEASGYMARAAFVMDRGMNLLGLQGQSFVPMILGFGCNVPAIYATRTIENRAARVLTGLLIPFMSCSARLPVYVIFGLAFFPARANVVIWGLYVTGIIAAAVVGIVLSRTLFRDSSSESFIMEMPPYRMPGLKELWRYTRTQSAAFVRKAGTFILLISLAFWLLINLPWGVESARNSYFGRLSATVAPVFAPAGFDSWEASGALVTGVLAKEAVVSSLSQVYVGAGGGVEEAAPGLLEGMEEIVVGLASATVEAGRQLLETLTPGVSLFPGQAEPADTALAGALQQAFTPLAALAFLAFVLLYVPCMAALASLVQEFGWRWAALSLLLTLLVPWSVAVLIYQGGQLVGLG
ncbi:MAG: ferrous iron transport protein B [Candidatus Promineifilaceae bacterium]|nr:ferrous iron transport protein B [Candidatus Promineifilaceae bacterium]